MLENLWDLYIDIKNIYKDIDKCPYTHIETINKYNEEIKKKKNNMFQFIFLNKISDNTITSSIKSIVDNNHMFLKKENITNLDIIINKYIYLYVTEILKSDMEEQLSTESYFPNMDSLIKSLNFVKWKEIKDHMNVNKNVSTNTNINVDKNGLSKNNDDSSIGLSNTNHILSNDNSEKGKENQKKKEKTKKKTETDTDTDTETKKNISNEENSGDVKNNICNLFLYNFPYQNNIKELNSYNMFGKILLYNNKYNYFNFDKYNNYDIFLPISKEEKKKKGFFFFKGGNNNNKICTSTKDNDDDYNNGNKNDDSNNNINNIKVHNHIDILDIDKDQINEELIRIKCSYYIFVHSLLRYKGASVYKKIFKVIKKKKRRTLIYTFFTNFFLLYYILYHADQCFDNKLEYEEFLKLQLLHINSNINTIHKLLKNEKEQNKVIKYQTNISNNENNQSLLNIRYKLYSTNIYTSLYIYLIDISLSYLFTPNMGISYMQDILSLFLFYNYICLYLTKILLYKV